MQFVKQAELKVGMRLARPIYNRNGVLLYERNSKLTPQGINSIRNFGLLGIFVLEPAEPVPPMTQEDVNFERFQTMTVFAIEEELQKILTTGKSPKTQVIVANILKEYGHMDKKINFIQNLRSAEDYVYKHSLNVSILCALMTHIMNLKLDEQLDTMIAAMTHDIGKLVAMKRVRDKNNITEMELKLIEASQGEGFSILENVFTANPGIKRICMQTQKLLADLDEGRPNQAKLVTGSKVLAVAEVFDTMTAMNMNQNPASEVETIKYLMSKPEYFDSEAVDALIKSINILVPGISVELNTGDKALVITENTQNILRPMVLSFRDNSIIDLSNRSVYGDLEIVDIMKTMDNRYIMDTSTLKAYGIHVEEPVYASYAEDDDAEEYIPGMY